MNLEADINLQSNEYFPPVCPSAFEIDGNVFDVTPSFPDRACGISWFGGKKERKGG